MPTPLSSTLVPYLQLCTNRVSTTLITSVLDTPAYWLVLRFIQAAISGVDENVGIEDVPRDSSVLGSSNPSIVFLSFLKPYDFWVDLGKKCGLDFATLTARKQCAYVDGLSTAINVLQPISKTVKLASHSLPDINKAIQVAYSAVSGPDRPQKRSVLVIDGLDFVLASQPDASAAQLSALIVNAQETFANVVLTAAADTPLLHNIEASSTPLEIEHSIFVRTIAHHSPWIFQLRPLETGHAKDVSGILRISRGGAGTEDDDDSLQDGEWLYLAKGDGNVKIWSRGE